VKSQDPGGISAPRAGDLTTASPMDDAPDAPPIARQIIVLSLIAIAVGLLAGAAAVTFVTVEHHLTSLLWNELPEALGQEQAPAWLVLTLLLTGALITYLAEKLPGGGGHTPLHGFGIDIGPREVLSVIIAALGSLSFGAVLGPEAPLMAIGTAMGALAFRDPTKPIRQVMMIVGAMAAIGAIFGNPLVTCVLMLEFAMLAGPRMATPLLLMPALAGMAASYVLQVGVDRWSGLGESQLGVPGLAPYPEVQFVDLVVAVPLAIVVAVVAMAARLGAQRVAELAARSRLATMLGAAVVVAVAAIAVDATTGGGLELVLFSGQSAMPDYLALTSVGTAVVVLIGKFIGYTASLGSGFRGGPIFPAVALGVILATTGTLLVDGTSTSALAAVGIAAGTAACMRMPFTALLLGVMLTYPAGGATTVLAILGTIVGLSTRLGGERLAPALAPAAP
jgi:H+/Cl- antiporter ClcA